MMDQYAKMNLFPVQIVIVVLLKNIYSMIDYVELNSLNKGNKTKNSKLIINQNK